MPAVFKPLMTSKGIALMAKAGLGAELKFTKLIIGDGQTTKTGTSITEVLSPKLELPITEGRIQQANTFTLGGVFSNAELDEPFWRRELGIIAEDPDEGEILYAYANAGDTADYIPTVTEQRIESMMYVAAAIGNAENVTVEVVPGLYAPNADFIAHKEANIHMNIANATGLSGGQLRVSLSGKTLKDGMNLYVRLIKDITEGAKLNFNETGYLPIITSDGQPIKKGAKAGAYLPLIYNNTKKAWYLIGGGGSGSGELLTRNQETIFPTTDYQYTFKLKKGTYTPNADCLDIVIDGVPQPHSAFKEIDETTFVLDSSFNIKKTTQIDVTYMNVSTVEGAETTQGAQMKVDELEKKFNSKLDKMIKTYKLPKANWSSATKKQSIQFEGLTEFSSIKIQYASPQSNVDMCSDCNIMFASSGGSTVTLKCVTIPTQDVIIDILYQGERNRYYTQNSDGTWTEHVRGN